MIDHEIRNVEGSYISLTRYNDNSYVIFVDDEEGSVCIDFRRSYCEAK